MNRRILIAAVTALSMAGITAASAEYDSAGVGTINPERFDYRSGNATQKYPSQGYSRGYASDGYMAYGSANTRVRVQDGYAGPRTSYEYRAQPRGAGGWCLDEDGNRFVCR